MTTIKHVVGPEVVDLNKSMNLFVYRLRGAPRSSVPTNPYTTMPATCEPGEFVYLNEWFDNDERLPPGVPQHIG